MVGLAVFWTYWVIKLGDIDYTGGIGLFLLMLWLTFSLGNAVVFISNIARAQDRTTVVPGVLTLWYRFYSAVLFSLMLALLITASTETEETWCGKSTVLGEKVVCLPI
jgi:hypothetical protein